LTPGHWDRLDSGRKPSKYRESTIAHVPPPKRHPYDQWSPDTRALDLVGDKWTLLIVRDLASGPRRFVELQRVLPGISTEQLRSRLNRMVADGMLTRKRYREVPPRVDYELTERARELMPVLGALARWGYEWSWSEPRPTEAVDIGAIFRLAPGLLERSEPARELEFAVTDAETRYTLRVAGDRVDVREEPASSPAAGISGSTAAWIAALSPTHDRSGLDITGDTALAGEILGALTSTSAAARSAARQPAAA
jgi:DNA-binding HxlR family transcriptional regulator